MFVSTMYFCVRPSEPAIAERYHWEEGRALFACRPSCYFDLRVPEHEMAND